MEDTGKRILMAKTGLDGHWRGPTIVATALRDAGFEVIMIGMARSEEVLQAAIDEDVDLVGLNIGGHIDVALRAVNQIQSECAGMPVFAGGVVPPHAKRKLEALGVEVYPPGSQLPDIVAAARRLTGLD
jgi:methylmalonyl-CoA mutase C-terminal domain/subunit